MFQEKGEGGTSPYLIPPQPEWLLHSDGQWCGPFQCFHSFWGEQSHSHSVRKPQLLKRKESCPRIKSIPSAYHPTSVMLGQLAYKWTWSYEVFLCCVPCPTVLVGEMMFVFTVHFFPVCVLWLLQHSESLIPWTLDVDCCCLYSCRARQESVYMLVTWAPRLLPSCVSQNLHLLETRPSSFLNSGILF